RIRRLRQSAWWRPSVAGYHLATRRPDRALPSDGDALRAAAEWLGRAQGATSDGGVAGRFRLVGGRASSDPETTRYLIPTVIALAVELADDRWRERAARCVDFLLSIQLPSGAFPAMEIADNRSEPSPFNSAQIAHGLHAWFRSTGDQRVLEPLVRAARWVC